ncbi:MAG: ABC transporter permease [Acidimicrobiia bacterium]|nr:ABC transporter permease [Acidimicrobiia bacterium]NNF63315.1 ABC transporter permease [Acidimicrobiia bacterium]
MTTTPDGADRPIESPDAGSQGPHDAAIDEIAVNTATRRQVRKEQWRVLYRSPGFIIGSAIMTLWIVSSFFPELLANFDPKISVTGPEGQTLTRMPPDSTLWFGTDRLGRDVYSRVIYGSRPIMIAAPAATIIAAVIGTLLGLLSGYFKGWVDELVSRLLEAILSIPAILLAIVIVFTFGATNPVIIGAIAFLFIPPIARTVRAATLAESQLDYVTAARMRGERSLFIIGREIFPNVTGVVVVEVTVRLGYAIFTLATLAFLGLSGGDVTDPNWGVDVAQNYQQIVAQVWWPTVFPALAIGTLVIGVNLIADSIERATKS